MRHNGPVTGREYRLRPGQTLVSTTDLKGRILHCNPAFIEASGFSREELQGQPHNLVRHPDMPEAAFRDMWETIAAGLPWSALVKNRRKNGDHYWVVANATPVMEGERPVGYMSVRTCPEPAQIEAAESLYRRLRAQETGEAPPRLALRRGAVVRHGLAGWVQSACAALRTHRLASLPVALGLGAFALGATVGLSPAGLAATAALALAVHALSHSLQTGPLHRLLGAVRRMAAGDLTQRIAVSGEGPVGELQRALNQLNVNLQAVVGDARSEVGQMDTAISEIAAGNRELSSRTEAQASSLEETAASMEQQTATVRNNAQASQDAARSASDTSTVTRDAHRSVQSLSTTIGEISQASRRIADITEVIDGISFQTNILALNAAVEAARAGEAGRGFAVVASEVRSLAQRTTGAAREIKELIAAAHSKVDAGVLQAQAAASAMTQVESQVAQTTQLIAQIGSASNEQLTGISEVNDAVALLDRSTQQNAAMVEELSAATAQLTERARILSESVQVFRVDSRGMALPDAVSLRRQAREPVVA